MDLIFNSIKRIVDNSNLNLSVVSNLSKASQKTFGLVVKEDVVNGATKFEAYDLERYKNTNEYIKIIPTLLDSIVGRNIITSCNNEIRKIIAYDYESNMFEIDSPFDDIVYAEADELILETQDTLIIESMSFDPVALNASDFRIRTRYIFRLSTKNDEYQEKLREYQLELISLFSENKIEIYDKDNQPTNRYLTILDYLSWNPIKINESEHITEGLMLIEIPSYRCA